MASFSGQNYRYWVLWRCRSVRFLDYAKVKDAERKRAGELFGTPEQPTELASKLMGIKSKTFDSASLLTAGGGSSSGGGSGGGLATKMARIKLTEKEKKRLQDMIKKATSLDEITRLETMLREGRLPAGVHLDGDEMEE